MITILSICLVMVGNRYAFILISMFLLIFKLFKMLSASARAVIQIVRNYYVGFATAYYSYILFLYSKWQITKLARFSAE